MGKYRPSERSNKKDDPNRFSNKLRYIKTKVLAHVGTHKEKYANSAITQLFNNKEFSFDSQQEFINKAIELTATKEINE